MRVLHLYIHLLQAKEINSRTNCLLVYAYEISPQIPLDPPKIAAGFSELQTIVAGGF